MIDLHSHILPGLDDGARTMDDSLVLAQAAIADGVEAIAATPHVRADYPTTADAMEEALGRVRSELAARGLPLDVVAGGEIDLAHLSLLSDEDLRRFSYGGLGRHLLLEFPESGWSLAIDSALAGVRTARMTPVLAHPERNRRVQEQPARLEALVERGALVQITAGSLEGRLGRRAQAAAHELVRRGLVHLLASDAHGPHIRQAGLAAAAALLGDDRVATQLTSDGPAAILAGEDPPPARPAPGRRSRWFGR